MERLKRTQQRKCQFIIRPHLENVRNWFITYFKLNLITSLFSWCELRLSLRISSEDALRVSSDEVVLVSTGDLRQVSLSLHVVNHHLSRRSNKYYRCRVGLFPNWHFVSESLEREKISEMIDLSFQRSIVTTSAEDLLRWGVPHTFPKHHSDIWQYKVHVTG